MVCKPKSLGGLGIRKLEHVNTAMFCKLGWASENNFDSMWVRAIKAKYFPHSSFMRCPRKKTNSWQWKGILSIRPVLANGLCFKVGKGNNINYWEDPSIPNNINYLPKPLAGGVNVESGMVESLILPDGKWNIPRLNTLFDKATVDNILKIFWVDKDEEDSLVWMGSASGTFKVKHVYRYIIHGDLERSKWWRFLWKSNLHGRVKFFMWKLASNGLPTRDILLRRKWDIGDRNCSHGCENLEDEVHLFFKCSVARAFWLASMWTIRWDNMQLHNLHSYLEGLANPEGKLPIHRNDEEDFFLHAALVLEAVWKVRNKVLFEGNVFSLEEEVEGVANRFREFKSSLTYTNTHHSIPSTLSTSWTPPPIGVLKINTDACLSKESASLGMVVRNNLGNVLKVQVKKVYLTDPEAAEAAAILQAISLARREGFTKIWCESDAQTVIHSINNPASPSVHWSVLGFIKKIVAFCPSFESVYFTWTPRNVNKLAHITARWGMYTDGVGLLSFLISSPRFVTILNQDCGLSAPHLDS